MATIIKAPNKFVKDDRVSIFLGGVIDQGKASNWAERISMALEDLDIVILNPRRDQWNASLRQSKDEPEFFEQVNWELYWQEECNLNIYVFGADEEDAKSSLAPITLLELGLFAYKNPLVCCPKSYWRYGNVDITCDRLGIKVVHTLEDLIPLIRKDIDICNLLCLNCHGEIEEKIYTKNK